VRSVCHDHCVSLFLPNVDTAERLPLRRPSVGRRLGGVCQGLALHLRVPVRTVRMVMLLAALTFGLGLVAYLFLWLTIPAGDPVALANELDVDARLVAQPNAVPPTQGGEVDDTASWWERIPLRDIATGVILVTVTAMLIADRLGAHLQWTWVFAGLIVLVGLFMAWGQLDSSRRGSLLEQAGGRTPVGVIRIAGGIALVIVGALLVLGQDREPSLMWQSLLASVVVLLGVAIVLAPWWLRTLNALGEERAAREIAKQRADIAAHLHDSVLQTLALIQRSVDQPGEVTRLARNQERELRAWLYNDRSSPGTSLASEARAVVANVENTMIDSLGTSQAISIDLVVVGDARPDENSEALLGAMNEALKNAVRHGRPPVSAYLEVRADVIEIFVTDRGDGFDVSMLGAVGPDRFGVRESIIGRVQRRGGSVEFRKMAIGGTEVKLSMPRQGHPVRSSVSPDGAQSLAPDSGPLGRKVL